MEYPSKICVCSREDLDAAIKLIMSDASCNLHKMIRSYVKQYPEVKRRCNLDDIYSEIFIRAVKNLHEKGEIPNLVGWMVIAAKYIILERNRALTKRDQIYQEINDDRVLMAKNFASESNYEREKVLAAQKSVDNLEPLDQAIVQLMAERIGWREICQRLINQRLLEDKYVSQTTIERIKKRGHRVTQKLRKSLKSLNVM